MSQNPEKKTFVLVQGFGHDEWHWNPLKPALRRLGHKAVTVALDIENPKSTFDDHGEAVANAIEDIEDDESVIGVFHSRAGNYGPRAVNILQGRNPGKLAIERMVFLNSSFENDTVCALGRPQPGENLERRNTPEFRELIRDRKDLGENMKMFNPKLAEKFLYHDVADKMLVREAIVRLRPQNRPANEEPLEEWPDMPASYIIAQDDRLVRPTWSQYICKNWLGIEPITMPGGHSPFLARPQHLAKVLDEIAVQNNNHLLVK